jgi:hypothetical protein
MRGTIVHYNANDGRGLIAARDGGQYPFGIETWRSNVSPRPDQVVDVAVEGRQATAVVLVPRSARLAEVIRHLLRRMRLPDRRGPPRSPSNP